MRDLRRRRHVFSNEPCRVDLPGQFGPPEFLPITRRRPALFTNRTRDDHRFTSIMQPQTRPPGPDQRRRLGERCPSLSALSWVPSVDPAILASDALDPALRSRSAAAQATSSPGPSHGGYRDHCVLSFAVAVDIAKDRLAERRSAELGYATGPASPARST